MKVLVTGGSGFIGSALTGHLRQAGHEVRWISRKPVGPEQYGWNPGSLGQGIAWAEGLVNLSGESVVGRWTRGKKRRILESRVLSTRNLVKAVRASGKRPSVLVSGSAIGIYGDRGQDALDEGSEGAGDGDFLASVCRQWEAEALLAREVGLRVCLVRTGHVQSPKGGALKAVLLPFRFGLGGRIASGRQWASWIHLTDQCRLIAHLLASDGLEGPFNSTAPHPVTNLEYSQTLAKVLHRPCVFPVPAFVFKLAFGQASKLMLDSQKVLPTRALEAGFKFEFETLQPALQNLLAP